MANILCVEDDALIGDVVRKLLSDAGHRVTIVEHGARAFDAIISARPDLVILDRSLPGVQGIDILKSLRQRPESYLTPVLMLTAERRGEKVREAVEAGADAYLLKPFAPDALLRKIEEMLRDHAQ
jgi:two-component system response regulator MtrA